MTFLYRIAAISEYCKEDFAKEIKNLPPTLASYVEEAKEGEPRARRLAGMRALSDCLSYLSLPAPPVAVGRYGKPYFTEGEYQFSISHAGGIAVAVLAPQRVGADLEPYDRALSDASIERIGAKLSEDERALLSRALPEHRRRTFLEIWVRKEALMKRGGRGLASFSEVDTVLDPPAFEDAFEYLGREYFLAVY